MIPPQLIAKAAQFLQGKITPEDIATFGKFAQMIEQGRAKGDLGRTGLIIQSFAKNIFGSKYGGETNPVIKRALDMLLQRMQIR